MRFLVLGDIHGRANTLRAILKAEPAGDGVVLVGDLTHAGDEREAEKITAACAAYGGKIMAVPGNMDAPGVLGFLEKSGYSIHGAGRIVGAAGFFGCGGSNPTPFHSPFELGEEEIGRLLLKGLQAVRQAAVKVLVAHVPPLRSSLDRTRLGLPGGSAAVRQFLKEHRVDICLCGHIHEAVGEETIEGARCSNPGAVREGRYARLEIENGKIELTRREISSWT
jgi:Icc-related predicted phosphoesterase